MVAKNHSTSSKSRIVTSKKPTKKKPLKKTNAKTRMSTAKKRTVSTKVSTTKSRKVTASKRKPVALQPVHKKLAGVFIVLAVLFVGAVGVVNTVRSSISNAAAIAGPITGIGGKCLDNAANRLQNSNKIQLFECNGTAAQKWTIPGDGTIRLGSEYCLDVRYASKQERTPVQLYKCNNTVAQQWVVKSNKTIVNPNSGLCLDDQYARTKNENPIWMYHCNGTNAQVWTLYTPVATTTGKDSDAATPTPVPTAPAATSTGPITGIAGKCLDNANNVIADHNKVQLYTCNNGASQKWTIPGDGTIRMQGYCLDVKYASKEERTLVQLYHCNGSVAQKWAVNANNTIVNPNSGLCLDDQYARTQDGNTIWMYHCNGDDAQKWTVYTPIASTTGSGSDSSTPAPSPAPSPQPSSQPTSGLPSILAGKGLTLMGGDEFNGSSLDTKKWKAYHNTYGDGNNELACLTPNNVSVSGGSLKIVSKREKITCPNGSVRDFSSGFIGSREVGKYYPKFAYYEMRAKLPHGQGLWPAFWLRHINGSSTAEVDIMEYFHSTSPGMTKSTLHLDGVVNVTQHRVAFEAPTSNPGWHTWGVYMEPAGTSGVKFTFFVDGVAHHTYTDTSPDWSNKYSQTNLFDIAINDAVGGRYTGHPDVPLGYLDILKRCAQTQKATSSPESCPKDGIRRAVFPATYEVDYVRVYAR